MYLRARYYSPWQGRFLSRDGRGGDVNQPLSYNKWLYGYGNPINRIDSSGNSPTALANFEREAGVADWTFYERFVVHLALLETAHAYADAYNQVLGRELFCQISTGVFHIPFIDHISAFLTVHGGPVTFKKTAQSNSFVWAITISSREIHLYRNAYIRDPRFIVHEIGHAFENAMLGTILDKAGRSHLPENLWYRHSDDPADPNAGFAGGFLEWQFSRVEGGYNPVTGADGRGEIFADMFVGWVYNRWATYTNGELTAQALERLMYMEDNMSMWVYAVINVRTGRWSALRRDG